MATITPDPRTYIARIKRDAGGFLHHHDIKLLAQHPDTRLLSVLVRCGGGRFTCPIQDVRHFIALIESGQDGEATDYVQDVSFPADGGR